MKSSEAISTFGRIVSYTTKQGPKKLRAERDNLTQVRPLKETSNRMCFNITSKYKAFDRRTSEECIGMLITNLTCKRPLTEDEKSSIILDKIAKKHPYYDMMEFSIVKTTKIF